MIDLVLPEGAGERLLWAQLALVWLAALYVVPRGPYGREEALRLRGATLRRWWWRLGAGALAAGLLAALLPGLTAERAGVRAGLGAGVALSALLLPVVRTRADGGTGWGMALAVDVVAVPVGLLGLGWFTAASGLRPSAPLVTVPFSTTGTIQAALLAGAALYLTAGGTHVVRSVLDGVTAKPEQHGLLDVPEYNRGRVIGDLERLLLVLFAVLGTYPAMAVVIAAKGLVRWPDLQNREFAEYFLIGSLTSLLLALAVGALLREVLLR